jgi:cytochrome o ubiquinol oxidase subunit 3
MCTPEIIMTEEDRKNDTTLVFGFWMYLMTDFVLFASLFATYAVLRAGALPGSLVFSAPFVLLETVILLTSSFTSGLTLLAARNGSKAWVVAGLVTTFALGARFLTMEVSEFSKLIAEGSGPHASGFLSSYFGLVGTHGLHIAIGLVWAIALAIAIARVGLTRSNMRKLMLWSMFWHFLDIVWIFIFTIVYLLAL